MEHLVSPFAQISPFKILKLGAAKVWNISFRCECNLFFEIDCSPICQTCEGAKDNCLTCPEKTFLA